MVARLEACETQALVQRGCGSGSHIAKAVESYIVSRAGEGACEVTRGADVVGQGLSSYSTAATVGASKHALKVLGFASLARKLRLVILILTAAKVSSQQPVRCDTRGSGRGEAYGRTGGRRQNEGCARREASLQEASGFGIRNMQAVVILTTRASAFATRSQLGRRHCRTVGLTDDSGSFASGRSGRLWWCALIYRHCRQTSWGTKAPAEAAAAVAVVPPCSFLWSWRRGNGELSDADEGDDSCRPGQLPKDPLRPCAYIPRSPSRCVERALAPCDASAPRTLL